ncbi:MAG: tetratricopeptide repeat protein [Chloroflexi bacterium]|nr:tetratricopeptide repeat protein [Chloroflexota bacterium]
MAEVERKGFRQEIGHGLDPRLWRRRTRFTLGFSAVLIVFLIISLLRTPTDESTHPALIIESIGQGRYEDALVALDKLEALYSDQALDGDIAWIEGERGFVYLQQGRYAEGVDILDRAISLDGTQPNYYNWRALNFFRLNRMADAEADFTAALELDSDNYLWHLDRGYFYLDSGNFESALLDAHAAINLMPDEPMAYGLRADANRRLGRNDVALFDLDTLVDLIPDDWQPYITRARVKSDLGDADGAIADLDAALALGPTPEGLEKIDLTRAAILGGTVN